MSHSSPTRSAAILPPDYDDLLGRVGRNKDKEAFIALFNHFAPRIKSFLMRGGMAEDAAEELAQETMLTMWQKAEKFDSSKAAASTWIFTIARNKKIDRLRKKGVITLDLDDLMLADAEPAVDQADLDWTHGDAHNRLARAMRDLPEEQAALVRKAFYEDMSHSEIAAATNLPLGTVKSRLRLGLARLRQVLKRDDF